MYIIINDMYTFIVYTCYLYVIIRNKDGWCVFFQFGQGSKKMFVLVQKKLKNSWFGKHVPISTTFNRIYQLIKKITEQSYIEKFLYYFLNIGSCF